MLPSCVRATTSRRFVARWSASRPLWARRSQPRFSPLWARSRGSWCRSATLRPGVAVRPVVRSVCRGARVRPARAPGGACGVLAGSYNRVTAVTWWFAGRKSPGLVPFAWRFSGVYRAYTLSLPSSVGKRCPRGYCRHPSSGSAGRSRPAFFPSASSTPAHSSCAYFNLHCDLECFFFCNKGQAWSVSPFSFSLQIRARPTSSPSGKRSKRYASHHHRFDNHSCGTSEANR